MDNTKLINKLRGKGFDELRDALKNILLVYCTPSFGSMTKHDIDLLMFDVMISLGIFDFSPSIYDVMRELKVTRSKARNLIYEHQLRSVENDNQLLAELREVLKCPLLSRKSDNVCLEIDNPYLMDFIRNELKKLGHITDGSFNSEMVFSKLFIFLSTKNAAILLSIFLDICSIFSSISSLSCDALFIFS